MAEEKCPPRQHNTTKEYVDTQNVSLKEYFDMRISDIYKFMSAAEKAHDENADEVQKSLDAHFDFQEKAIKVAADASDKRLEGMNEFRATLTDQSKTFVTTEKFDSFKEYVDTKIDQLKVDIQKIEISDATLSGKASQSQVVLAYIFTGIGALIGIISLILSIIDRLSRT